MISSIHVVRQATKAPRPRGANLSCCCPWGEFASRLGNIFENRVLTVSSSQSRHAAQWRDLIAAGFPFRSRTSMSSQTRRRSKCQNRYLDGPRYSPHPVNGHNTESIARFQYRVHTVESEVAEMAHISSGSAVSQSLITKISLGDAIALTHGPRMGLAPVWAMWRAEAPCLLRNDKAREIC